MPMRIEMADQYARPCIVLEGGESADNVIEHAWYAEAIFNDGEDECYVIQFPGRPPELYTEDALRRSLADKDQPRRPRYAHEVWCRGLHGGGCDCGFTSPSPNQTVRQI